MTTKKYLTKKVNPKLLLDLKKETDIIKNILNDDANPEEIEHVNQKYDYITRRKISYKKNSPLVWNISDWNQIAFNDKEDILYYMYQLKCKENKKLMRRIIDQEKIIRVLSAKLTHEFYKHGDTGFQKCKLNNKDKIKP